MTKTELIEFNGLPINYRIAGQVGVGILVVGDESVSITASNAEDGVVGVEPIRLTQAQWSEITHKDGVLLLEVQ